METAGLKNMWVCSNNDLHAKGQQMSAYAKLVRKWFCVKFISEVYKHDHDVHFSLKESYNYIRLI